MRFHRLKIQNLNSLYGEHTVDLEGQLGGAGLFLIFGPTGSGKSTLLDAIALALYGQTPRLDAKTVHNAVRIDGVNPNAPSLSMSRGTAQCLAEVEFSIAALGEPTRRYRASWYVQRARKRPDGALQTPVRRLEREDDGAWQVLVESSQPKQFDKPFADALQDLSFEDFQRTTMLAQFSFRQFLDADEKARANLLERMTASDRFRRIGKAAADARKAAEEAVTKLATQLGGKTVLSAAEEAERRVALAAAEAEAAAQRAELARLEARRGFWTGLVKARATVASAQAEVARAATERAAHAEALAALVDDEAVAPARLALMVARAARKAQGQAADALAQAELKRAGATAARDAAAGAHGVAAAGAQAAEAALQAAEPALAEALVAWRALDDARRDERTARSAADLRTKAAAEAAKVADRAEQVATAAQAELVAATAELGQIPAHDRVGAAVGQLEALLAGLTRDQGTLAAKRKAFGAKAGEKKGLEQRAEPLAQAAADAAAKRDQARAQAEVSEAALRATTGGEAPEATAQRLALVRHERSQALERLEAHEGLVAEVAALAGEAAAKAVRAAAAAAAAQEAADEGARLEADLARDEAAGALAGREVARLDKTLHLVEQRGVLEAGAACPLCGSTTHPYREAPETAPDSAAYARERAEVEALRQALERAVKDARAALKAAQRREEQAKAEASAAGAEGERLAADAEAKRGRAVAVAAALGLAEGHGAAARGALRARLEAERAAAVAQGEQLAGLSAAARTAQEGLRGAELRAAAAAEAVSDNGHALALVAAALEALEADGVEFGAHVKAAEEALTAALRAVEIVAPVTLGGGVAEAKERAKRTAELAEAVGRLGERAQRAATALADARTKRDGAEHEAAAAGEALAAAVAAVTRAAEASREHFEGQDPEVVRGALAKAVKGAADAVATAVLALGEREAALAAAVATVRERAEGLRLAQEAAAEAERGLVAQCAACAVADEAAVDARSLGDAQRAGAQALRERLARQDAVVGGRVREAERALGECEAARPADEPADAVAADRLAALEAARGEVDQARSAAEQQVGGLRGELERDAADREARAALMAAKAAADEDCGHWQQIAEVIGTNEGQAFVQVVQALNLRAVIARANARLVKFMPRYELAQVVDEGRPRLDFHVVDQWNQGARRTVKSLSGGESFIVSLALALGLADLRSAKLRIETLLIDEGFGSLDNQTLQEVLAALGTLQQASGAQIGLISHVEAMRDAVPAQIEVVPLGEGRSRLEVRG